MKIKIYFFLLDNNFVVLIVVGFASLNRIIFIIRELNWIFEKALKHLREKVSMEFLLIS